VHAGREQARRGQERKSLSISIRRRVVASGRCSIPRTSRSREGRAATVARGGQAVG
jgi:hypothetical protein